MEIVVACKADSALLKDAKGEIYAMEYRAYSGK